MSLQVKKNYNENKYNEVYRLNREVTSFEAKVLLKFIYAIDKENPAILDLGCGTGKPYDEFLVNNYCCVTGVDFSKNHISWARLNVPNANYICSDIMKFKCIDVYDGAVMLYSLFHIHRDHHLLLLKKIYNSISDNGKVLLNVRREDSGNIKYRENFCGKPMYWSHYGYTEFKRIAEESGFKVHFLGDEKDYGSNESHIWLLLKKTHKNNFI